MIKAWLTKVWYGNHGEEAEEKRSRDNLLSRYEVREAVSEHPVGAGVAISPDGRFLCASNSNKNTVITVKERGANDNLEGDG